MDQKTVNQFKQIINDALANVATKDDILLLRKELKATKEELLEEIKESEGFTTINADTNKADKIVVEALIKKVAKIEQQLSH